MKPTSYTPREQSPEPWEAIFILLLVALLFSLAGCATKKVATTAHTSDKSNIKTDSTFTQNWRDELLKDKSITITWTEVEETTTAEVKDSTGTVVVPGQKTRQERKYTASHKDVEQIIKDSTKTAEVKKDEQKDVITTAEEKIIPPNRTAMWVFFSLALCVLVGGAWWVKKNCL